MKEKDIIQLYPIDDLILDWEKYKNDLRWYFYKTKKYPKFTKMVKDLPTLLEKKRLEDEIQINKTITKKVSKI